MCFLNNWCTAAKWVNTNVIKYNIKLHKEMVMLFQVLAMWLVHPQMTRPNQPLNCGSCLCHNSESNCNFLQLLSTPWVAKTHAKVPSSVVRTCCMCLFFSPPPLPFKKSVHATVWTKTWCFPKPNQIVFVPKLNQTVTISQCLQQPKSVYK